MANYKTMCMTLACASVMLLNACTSRSVATGRIPEDGLTVSQIYHQSMQESAASWTAPRNRVNRAQKPAYEDYTRTASNETQALFKPLDNPSIPIYVYPHVALIGDEQLVKPGFTTAFFLYKQNQFALASEHY